MLQLLILLNVFFVSFTDKPEKSAPALSPRAIEQRQKWDIPIDVLDYPVSNLYVDSLRKFGATVHHTSRWFNGVTCTMTDVQAAKVAQWSFVTGVEMTRMDASAGAPVAKRRDVPASQAEGVRTFAGDVELVTDKQLALYNLQPLHDLGYRGQGILMTICDGGFTNVNTLSCFRQEQELGHFDFTDDVDDFYGYTGSHGTHCLSTISGLLEYEYYGAATEAQYYLMRSEEVQTESPKEMDNLVAALEKADSLGTNVFSVSLGYYYFDNSEWDLTYDDLDGKATRVSRAATIAARKGMLVCAAAGNEGNKPWKRLCVPSDADSVLTVGAVNMYGVIGAFSSYGPSADGRVKPEVCAVGVNTALIDPLGSTFFGNGTSYATPLLAGLAATLWSALPDENAMQIRERIIRSADRYSHPDSGNRYGYGIPDAYAAYLGKTTAITDTPISTHSVKYIQGNTFYIQHGGKTYDVMGRVIR